MEAAQIWTLIGVLTATILAQVGMMLRFFGDLRDVGKDLTGLTVKIERLDHHFDTLEGRFDTLEGRFGTLENRFGTLEDKVGSHDQRFDALEEQIRQQGRDLGNAIYSLAEQLRNHLRGHAS